MLPSTLLDTTTGWRHALGLLNSGFLATASALGLLTYMFLKEPPSVLAPENEWLVSQWLGTMAVGAIGLVMWRQGYRRVKSMDLRTEHGMSGVSKEAALEILHTFKDTWSKLLTLVLGLYPSDRLLALVVDASSALLAAAPL